MSFSTTRRALCKIDNGEIIPYNLCRSVDKNPFEQVEHFEYIGTGTIHVIDGVIQKSNYRYHFYKHKEQCYPRRRLKLRRIE